MAIAPATPAILPVPTVAANAVQTAWNGVTAPWPASVVRWNILPMVFFHTVPNLVNCKKPVRMLRYSPTPKMSTVAGRPHTMPFNVPLILAMVSIICVTSLLYTVFWGLCGKGYKKTPPPLHIGIRTKAKTPAWYHLTSHRPHGQRLMGAAKHPAAVMGGAQRSLPGLPFGARLRESFTHHRTRASHRPAALFWGQMCY